MRTQRGHRGPRPTGPGGRRVDSRRPQPGPRERARPRPQEWFAGQLLLVLSGQRPVTSLLGHVRDPAYELLAHLAPLAPLRPADGDPAPALRLVRGTRPSSSAIEACAVISVGERTRALAFRLEQQPGGWRCTAVELDTVP
ncbi:Rv3235 family protein [Streptomyces sp. DSM 44915]|uniref:Rv3235 family protein n=1 Tax=Streptomyces chisholmiae TaxID=3075540 RepID=A0ABU2JSV2_9ACTN|nr:Rv3235 family protein [Streptomyces sp. DSM 44915]MDT0267831.1 Rv3235 family protein [Streptomyces sp. DSM 44915]